VEDFKLVKNELQNIISGKVSQSQSHSIQAAKTYIGNHTEPGSEFKSSKPGKPKEERALREYASINKLFINKESLGTFITEGAEQKMFYKENETALYKIADAIFYITWVDYLNNLLLHNYFFPDTAYTLARFMAEDDKFYVVLQQQFVLVTGPTNLNIIKNHLLSNGFLHKKNNDYFHPYLGIILEDVHDENVLTNDGVLFFVGTVFYLKRAFYGE
jgi:Serine/Threonine/Tyrosine Kinase found in polyvalent proteins